MRGCLITLGVIFLVLILTMVGLFVFWKDISSWGLNALFDSLDTDGSGTLSLVEYQTQFPADDPAMAAMFPRLDLDGNGELSRVEFGNMTDAVMATATLASADATTVIAQLDGNGDGRVDAAELQGLGLAPTEAAAVMQSFDADKDGGLNAAELEPALAQARQSLGQP